MAVKMLNKAELMDTLDMLTGDANDPSNWTVKDLLEQIRKTLKEKKASSASGACVADTGSASGACEADTGSASGACEAGGDLDETGGDLGEAVQAKEDRMRFERGRGDGRPAGPR
jgi:hypothetical protein